MKKYKRVCAEKNCNCEFKTNYERKIFCSDKCQRREWNRSNNAKLYRSTKVYKMKKREYDVIYKQKRPEVITAHIRARKVPIQPCEVCSTKENVHKHHDDYSKPLEVRFLCDVHHGEMRRING